MTGTSAYVALTDLPAKERKAPEPPKEEGAEGDAEEPAAEEEAPPAKPKHQPKLLSYGVAYPAAQQTLLEGKTIARNMGGGAAEGEEEEGEGKAKAAAPGSGVAFNAIDAYLKAGTKSLHVPRAVQQPQVKFWNVPRAGDFAVAPFVDEDGDVVGTLMIDTLGSTYLSSPRAPEPDLVYLPNQQGAIGADTLGVMERTAELLGPAWVSTSIKQKIAEDEAAAKAAEEAAAAAAKAEEEAAAKAAEGEGEAGGEGEGGGD
jgi:hypothetical protein